MNIGGPQGRYSIAMPVRAWLRYVLISLEAQRAGTSCNESNISRFVCAAPAALTSLAES